MVAHRPQRVESAPGRAAPVPRGELKNPQAGTPAEVLRAFLRLGLTAFGGPVAHLGYFRTEFVVRRAWLSEHDFAELVALCQFLPGPASSQTGFALGLRRAGWRGALAAWCGFTLPAAVLLTAFAWIAPALDPASPLLHGLQLVAVPVIAGAVLGMARTLVPDLARAAIALAALAAALLVRIPAAQAVVLAGGALAGVLLCRRAAGAAPPAPTGWVLSRRAGTLALGLFAVLLFALPLGAARVPQLALPAAVYRCGALVFGGGHVVLPLLRESFVVPGWMSDAQFLAGYGAAQAVPGPLFSFAAYLGASAHVPPGGLAGALIALLAIFLPGLLLLIAALPFWATWRRHPAARAAVLGVNAAVVGLLAAALYRPVWISTVHGGADAALAGAGFLILTLTRLPPWAVVGLTVLGAWAIAR